jgi:hypothetical protein
MFAVHYTLLGRPIMFKAILLTAVVFVFSSSAFAAEKGGGSGGGQGTSTSSANGNQTQTKKPAQRLANPKFVPQSKLSKQARQKL